MSHKSRSKSDGKFKSQIDKLSTIGKNNVVEKVPLDPEIHRKILETMSGRIPAHVSYDDGDQSRLSGEECQALRLQWASGMDYQPHNPLFRHLSDWMKVIFSGDYKGFLRMIDGKSEAEVSRMISKRETLCNVSAIFHVIIGARSLGIESQSFLIRPLMDCKMEHLKILDKLLSLGCDLNVRDFSGFTPLHHCCTGSQDGDDISVTLKMAEKIIKAGADVNAKDRGGGTPLHEAVLANSYSFVQLLLENGADPYQECYEGVSPLSISHFRPKMKELIGKSYINKLKEEKKKSSNDHDHRNCGGCGKNAEDNKKCTGCFHVFYCSRNCQVTHWAQHKADCKEIQSEYKSIHCTTDDGYVHGIDIKGKEYKVEPGSCSKKSHFVVKIQVPLLEEDYESFLVVYNRDKSFLTHVWKEKNEEAYIELVNIIRSHGFKGMKGYFHAILGDESLKIVRINTKRILPPQPW